MSDNHDMFEDPGSTSLRETRAEVQTLVNLHRESRQKPPFATEEMIAMALILGPVEGMDAKDIIAWILRNFIYFHPIVLEKYLEPKMPVSPSNRDADMMANTIPTDFWEAIRAYTLPVQEPRSRFYSIREAEARMFLRHYLEPQRQGVFRFLDLPAELREEIYQYMLTLNDEKGLGIVSYRNRSTTARRWRGQRLALLQRENGSSPRGCGTTWATSHKLTRYRNDGDNTVIAPSMKNMLAVLAVCKQIYREAVPCFFTVNKFVFPTAAFLKNWASIASADRFKHLTDIEIVVSDGDCGMEPLSDCAAMLRCVQSLKRLSFSSTLDSAFLGDTSKARKNLGYRARFKTYDQIPGMLDLVLLASKATKLDIEGDECPIFKEFIDAGVKKIKADCIAAKTSVSLPKKQKGSKKVGRKLL